MSFRNIAKEAEKFKSDEVEIELETRTKIPPQINFKGKRKVIKYYRSTVYPSITFRSNDKYINKKELIKSQKIDGVMTYLSVERNYAKSELKTPLIEIKTRIIYRMKIQEDPLVEIIKSGSEYTLEIEFDIYNYNKLTSIINKYKCFYFPLQKPMEISSINLARKLRSLDQWGFSYKADGVHVLVLEKENHKILLFDNGTTKSIKNKTNRKMIKPSNVYEGELMGDEVLYFDCLMYDNKNLCNLPYIERRKYIDKKKKLKELYLYNNLKDIKEFINNRPYYNIDGYIITNLNNKHLTYKSKFINTVDLRYKNGYLLLENEELSDRVCIEELENDKIYEFDLNFKLIKERSDKTIANYKLPYDNNPLFKIINGDGVPSLRVNNNKIKYQMLNMLDKGILIDIGSGKGGDINKWINLDFKRVYAIDPLIDLRQHNKKIIELNCNAFEIPEFIKYDCVSILYVPWDPSFIDIINKSKQAIIIIMDKPINYSCESFECKIIGKKVYLNIKNTETATEIIEDLYDFYLNDLTNYKIVSLRFKLEFGTEEEQILSSMYSYYYIERK